MDFYFALERQCNVQVTSSCHVASQLIQELQWAFLNVI